MWTQDPKQKTTFTDPQFGKIEIKSGGTEFAHTPLKGPRITKPLTDVVNHLKTMKHPNEIQISYGKTNVTKPLADARTLFHEQKGYSTNLIDESMAVISKMKDYTF